MNHLPACRVCLAHDTRLCSIMDSQFRDIYEKLVGESLDTEDMLPTAVCYICFASMKKMLQFRDRSQKANQILRQMISSGLELSVSSLDMLVKNQTGLSWTLKISDIERTTTTSADDEVKVKIESAESEMDIDRMSDRNEAADLARTTMYPFPGGIPVPCPISVNPEMSQVAASWHTPSMDPISSAASGFRSRNTTSLTISSFSLSRSQEKGSSSSASDKPAESSAANSMEQNKKPHIKKPLNAFMIYMKEMRAKVVEEYTLKESAAINRILGRQWHSLSREEQAKYYERASQEQQLHMQLYPGWSARDNYGYGSRKKKSKRDRTLGGNSLKKCRARYGYDQRDQWCEPCRRKKKCARYMKALAAATRGVTRLMAAQSPCSDDEIKLEILSDASDDGGDADTPLNSSWLGGLGALSSLAAPAPAPPHGGAATLRTFRKSRN